MNRILIATLTCTVVACDDGPTTNNDAADLVALTERVSALEVALAAAQAELAAQQPTVDAAVALTAVMSVDGDGDVVVEGANLRIQSGEGSTAATPNGKGNLIIGYNEAPTTCIAGSRAGLRCMHDGDCPSSVCGEAPDAERGGSHNLVMGERNSYASYGGIVNGRGSRALGFYSSVLNGAFNTVEAVSSLVLTGGDNTIGVDGSGSLVVVGARNAIQHPRSVIVGTSDLTTTASDTILP